MHNINQHRTQRLHLLTWPIPSLTPSSPATTYSMYSRPSPATSSEHPASTIAIAIGPECIPLQKYTGTRSAKKSTAKPEMSDTIPAVSSTHGTTSTDGSIVGRTETEKAAVHDRAHMVGRSRYIRHSTRMRTEKNTVRTDTFCSCSSGSGVRADGENTIIIAPVPQIPQKMAMNVEGGR
jgi:hypothetical protein